MFTRLRHSFVIRDSTFVIDPWHPLCRIAMPALSSRMSSLQAQIEERGERIFDLVDRYPESIFSTAGFYQRMMALSMRDEHFKVQMFRFVDVLASLRRSGDIVQHLEEYFAPAPAGRNGFAAYKP